MATRRGPDNSVRFSISGTIAGVAWANVFWAQLTTSGTPVQANLDTWLTTVSTAYKTRFTSTLPSQVSFGSAQAQLFLPGGLMLPSFIAMTGAGTGGTITGDSSAKAQVISWQTGVYWRGGKPRTYLPPGIAANQDDSNNWSATWCTSLATVANNWKNDVNAVTAAPITATQLGLMSFVHDGAPRPTPLFYAFTGAKVHPRLGTQRRRLGRWVP